VVAFLATLKAPPDAPKLRDYAIPDWPAVEVKNGSIPHESSDAVAMVNASLGIRRVGKSFDAFSGANDNHGKPFGERSCLHFSSLHCWCLLRELKRPTI
jgi:hypothetical protein